MRTLKSMKLNILLLTTLVVLFQFTGQSSGSSQSGDPLPSWNDGSNKQAIIDFVSSTTSPGNRDYLTAAERIATFDNDGTLWSEQPLYFQAIYIFDRIRELAPEHPEWQHKEPYASVLKGDLESALDMIVHHDDAKREWAYDRESHIGRLVRGLDEGPQRGWKIISMKNDWNLIYP